MYVNTGPSQLLTHSQVRHENCTVDHCMVVADPHHFDGDPYADPDFDFLFDTDPDHDFYLMPMRIRVPKVMHINADPDHCCCTVYEGRVTGCGRRGWKCKEIKTTLHCYLSHT